MKKVSLFNSIIIALTLALALGSANGAQPTGAGIIPYIIEGGQLYFFLGTDSHKRANGYDAFSGALDRGEDIKTGAAREGHEETMGIFSGTQDDPKAKAATGIAFLKSRIQDGLCTGSHGTTLYINVTDRVQKIGGRDATLKLFNTTLANLKGRGYAHEYTEKENFKWFTPRDFIRGSNPEVRNVLTWRNVNPTLQEFEARLKGGGPQAAPVQTRQPQIVATASPIPIPTPAPRAPQVRPAAPATVPTAQARQSQPVPVALPTPTQISRGASGFTPSSKGTASALQTPPSFVSLSSLAAAIPSDRTHSIPVRNDLSNTLLHEAAYYGNSELIRELRASGEQFSLNSKGENPLAIAMRGLAEGQWPKHSDPVIKGVSSALFAPIGSMTLAMSHHDAKGERHRAPALGMTTILHEAVNAADPGRIMEARQLGLLIAHRDEHGFTATGLALKLVRDNPRLPQELIIHIADTLCDSM